MTSSGNQEKESLQSFSMRFKHASKDREFGSTLNQMLVHQLIAGVHSKSTAIKLLESSTGSKLTFSEAVQIAEATELNKFSASFLGNYVA